MRTKLLAILVAIPLALSLSPVTFATPESQGSGGGSLAPLVWETTLAFTGKTSAPVTAEKFNPSPTVSVVFSSAKAAAIVTLTMTPKNQPSLAYSLTYLVTDKSATLLFGSVPTQTPVKDQTWAFQVEAYGFSQRAGTPVSAQEIGITIYGVERFEGKATLPSLLS